jgi:hypothetical protein
MKLHYLKIIPLSKEPKFHLNIKRNDGIHSNCIEKRYRISGTYIPEIIITIHHWKFDNQIDIWVSSENTYEWLNDILDLKFISRKFKNNNEENIIPLSYFQKGKEIQHSIDTLQNKIDEPLIDYLKKLGIKLFKRSDINGQTKLYANFKVNTISALIHVFTLSAIMPLFIEDHLKLTIEQERTEKNEQINKIIIEKQESKFKILLILFFTLMIGGCYTCGTKEKIGAKCMDGTSSSATGTGACSHHGGVRYWKYEYWWDD